MKTKNHLKAEMAVLVNLLSFENAYDNVSHMLNVEHFSITAHQLIFQAVVDLANASESYDLVMVQDLLVERGQFSDKGCSQSHINKIMDMPITLAKSIVSHANLVVRKSKRREAVRRFKVGIQSLEDGDNQVDDVINDTVSSLNDLQSKVIVKEVFNTRDMIAQQIEDMKAARDGVQAHISVGFPELSNLMKAGSGDLVIVAGRPSMGKSLLVVNMQTHIAQFSEGESVFFSIEMNEKQLGKRLMAAEANIPINTLIKGDLSEEQWASYFSACTRISDQRLTIVRKTELQLSHIRSHLNRVLRKKGKISSIGIDYLGLMNGLNGNDSVKRIGDVTRSLKAIGDEFGCPVFLLCQLNRSVEDRPNKRPLLSDLRDSGTIEQDADQVVFVYRDDYYKQTAGNNDLDGMAEIIIAKNRNGEIGTVRLAFEGAYGRFSNHMPYHDSMNNGPIYGGLN